MTTSLTTQLTSAISDNADIGPAVSAYFRTRLKLRIQEKLLNIFLDEKERGLTKAEIARRLGKKPEQITRWLTAPGNLSLDTISDLLLAMNQELLAQTKTISLVLTDNRFHELSKIRNRSNVTSGSRPLVTVSSSLNPEVTRSVQHKYEVQYVN